MLTVFGMAGALWGFGILFKVSHSARWGAIVALFGVVILLHLVLEEGQALRMALGKDAAPFALLLGFGVIVWGYRRILRILRKKSEQTMAGTTDKAPLFSETELDRYARHIVLREVGGTGQKALKEAAVLVVGAGGLGAPVLQYLAAAGVGTIGVIDDDAVDNGNLQRQVIHRDQDIGKPKVFSAQVAMEAQNPYVTVRPYARRLEADIASELIAEYDLVLDGCDNFETRYLVNKTCVELGKPLISGALTQWEGQLSVFDPAQGTPCYQCIFPQAPSRDLAPSCAEAGVIGPLPGVIGSMMAVEAIKLITKAGTPLRNEMVIYDALYGESRKIRLTPRKDCPICAALTHS